MADIRAGTVVFDLQANTAAARAQIATLANSISALEARAAALGAAGASPSVGAAALLAEQQQAESASRGVVAATSDQDDATRGLITTQRESRRELRQQRDSYRALRQELVALEGATRRAQRASALPLLPSFGPGFGRPSPTAGRDFITDAGLRSSPGTALVPAARGFTIVPPEPLAILSTSPTDTRATAAASDASRLERGIGRPTLFLPGPGQSVSDFDQTGSRALVPLGPRALAAQRDLLPPSFYQQLRGELFRQGDAARRAGAAALRETLARAFVGLGASTPFVGRRAGAGFNRTFDDPSLSDEDRDARRAAFDNEQERAARERARRTTVVAGGRARAERERRSRRIRRGSGLTAFGGPLAPSVAGFGVPPGAVGGASLLAGGFIGITAISAAARAVGHYANAWSEIQDQLGNFTTNLSGLREALGVVDGALRDSIGSLANFAAGNPALQSSLDNLANSIGSLISPSSEAGQRLRTITRRGAEGAAGVIDFLGGTPERLASTLETTGAAGAAAVSGFTANIIARPIAIAVGLAAKAIGLLPGPFGLVARVVARLAEATPSLATAFGVLAPFSEELRENFGRLRDALGLNIENLIKFGKLILAAANTVTGAFASVAEFARRVLGDQTDLTDSQLREDVTQGTARISQIDRQIENLTGARARRDLRPLQLERAREVERVEGAIEQQRLRSQASNLSTIRDQRVAAAQAEVQRAEESAEAARQRAQQEAIERRERTLAAIDDLAAGREASRALDDLGRQQVSPGAARVPFPTIRERRIRRGGRLRFSEDRELNLAERRDFLGTRIAQLQAGGAPGPARQRRIESLQAERAEIEATIEANTRRIQAEQQFRREEIAENNRLLAERVEAFRADFVQPIGDALATLATRAILDFENLSDSFDNFIRSVANSIIGSFAQRAADSIVDNFIAGFTSGLTGGASGRSGTAGRQYGGPVRAGESYVVGERGPELFTAGASGFVTPNNRLEGGGPPIVNNWYSNDPASAHRALQEFRPQLIQAARVQGGRDRTRRVGASF